MTCTTVTKCLQVKPGLWSRSPRNFGLLESEPEIFDGVAEVEHLSSSSTALVCGANELTNCEAIVGCRMLSRVCVQIRASQTFLHMFHYPSNTSLSDT